MSYSRLTPRFGVAYDVFGNGKTALKVNVGKYLAAADGSSITGRRPIRCRADQHQRHRTWTDANGNFKPDCDLSNLPVQDLRASGGDFCGQVSNLNFAKPVSPTTTYDPAILSGWGIRPYDWNLGVQVQQQLLPRVSVDVGYFRRFFGNFLATDNLAVTASDFGALQHHRTGRLETSWWRRPGISGTSYNVNPLLFGQTNNFISKADNYGTQINHWNGVEINFAARIRQGLTFQGGTSTGRTTTDSCEIRAKRRNARNGLGGRR